MRYEIARPSLRNMDLSSDLIPVGVQMATLALAEAFPTSAHVGRQLAVVSQILEGRCVTEFCS